MITRRKLGLMTARYHFIAVITCHRNPLAGLSLLLVEGGEYELHQEAFAFTFNTREKSGPKIGIPVTRETAAGNILFLKRSSVIALDERF